MSLTSEASAEVVGQETASHSGRASGESMRLRFYLVNRDFPPIGGPGIWRILAFSKYLALAGHSVRVFCTDRSSWHSRTDPSLLRIVPDGVRVDRIPGLFPQDVVEALKGRIASTRSGLVKRVLGGLCWRLPRYWPDPVAHWALKTVLAVWRNARRERPDIIFTTGPGHLAHLSGYVASGVLGIPWIMDYRDPWTGMSDGLLIADGPYQRKLFERVEAACLRRADAVVTVSPDWLERLRRQVPGQTDKFHLIRNGQDLDEGVLQALKAGVAGAGPRPLRIHFNGTIQSGNNVLPELEAAAGELVRSGITADHLRFSFCGLTESFQNAPRRPEIAAFFEDFGPLSHAASLERCMLADCLLVMVRDQGDISVGTIPAKTYESIALGRHILGILPPCSDTRELLRAYPCAALTAGTGVSDIVPVLSALVARFHSGGYALPTLAAAEHASFYRKYSRKDQTEELLTVARALVLRRQARA